MVVHCSPIPGQPAQEKTRVIRHRSVSSVTFPLWMLDAANKEGNWPPTVYNTIHNTTGFPLHSSDWPTLNEGSCSAQEGRHTFRGGARIRWPSSHVEPFSCRIVIQGKAPPLVRSHPQHPFYTHIHHTHIPNSSPVCAPRALNLEENSEPVDPRPRSSERSLGRPCLD